MLQGTDTPEEGYRLALRSNFRVNPLVSPQSHQYVIDLVHAHPLMPTGRMINMLRARLQNAFMQALVEMAAGDPGPRRTVQGKPPPEPPSERKGRGLARWRGCAPRAPRTRCWAWPCLLGDHWAYLDQKRNQMLSLGVRAADRGPLRDGGALACPGHAAACLRRVRGDGQAGASRFPGAGEVYRYRTSS
jgi:hypothetical protein